MVPHFWLEQSLLASMTQVGFLEVIAEKQPLVPIQLCRLAQQ
jgi:hypothetical protein